VVKGLDKDWYVREQSVDLIGEFPKFSKSFGLPWCTSLPDLEDIWENSGLAEKLVAKLQDQDNDVREAAIKALVKLVKNGKLISLGVCALYNI
jgi:hypothetical protein